MTGPRITALLFAGLWLASCFWYGGRGEPLTPQETESLLAAIRANADARGRDADELLQAFRTLAESDDGAEFYMLNLMRYRERAVYPPGFDYGDGVTAAADRYSRAIGPELLRRAALPVFFGAQAGTFLSPEGADAWDDVAIVRYRSRRDMLEMAVALSSKEVGVHKWASIEKTHVFPVKTRFDFVFVRGALAVVLLGLWYLGLPLWRRLGPGAA